MESLYGRLGNQSLKSCNNLRNVDTAEISFPNFGLKQQFLPTNVGDSSVLLPQSYFSTNLLLGVAETSLLTSAKLINKNYLLHKSFLLTS